MPHLHEMIPDAEMLLALDPEELGGLLLQVMVSMQQPRGMFHPSNYEGDLFAMSKAVYPRDRQDEILSAVREAFAWLGSQVLIVPAASTNGQNGWRVLSRKGKRLASPVAWASYQKANLLPRSLLHPTIADAVIFDFLRGHYDSAVFKAFKEVEVAVRAAAALADADLGVKLMQKAFGEAGPLSDKAAEASERVALMNMFAGAIGSYKNPHSHRRVELDVTDAVEMIVLASHLRRIVDARDPRKATLVS